MKFNKPKTWLSGNVLDDWIQYYDKLFFLNNPETNKKFEG